MYTRLVFLSCLDSFPLPGTLNENSCIYFSGTICYKNDILNRQLFQALFIVLDKMCASRTHVVLTAITSDIAPMIVKDKQ